ncbi:mechanosensitive ion channel family protein [Alteromonas sp. BL110]|uniref:mechanosensitive ion channel family protein n=1 Tax=Alteromonas sp. BL110 TaxID=1714845 RepID=UPI000E54F0ED|nr:mechanosensitive ion channel family protein [Alteromonas sp. BL110]AXT38094.1 mechanosensitive ion channel family protein [Alteromonas sp. BL110]RKM80837.1 mechanosensitive ion channel family protein [Alteromonas sp. BL110]
MDTEKLSGTARTSLMDTVFSAFLDFVPLLIAIGLVLSTLITLHYLFLAKQSHLTSEQKLPRQVGMLVLTIIGAVVIAMTLPVSESTRNQVIALIGVLISGVIAFSSTTMVGNLMAGIVLRVNRPFRVGDFIKVEGYSGRVTEMGLLDVEIQTESRELIAFANTLMVNSPVSVTRASGAIVSVDISLGYDIHHSVIEKHLLAAAENAKLTEPFVQVMGLGDFSVSYRISGLLTEVKSLLSARSRLHKAVLDALHDSNIEIVSPSFMNQRPQTDGLKMIAKSPRQITKEEASPEDVIFDKAEQAEQKEKSKETLLQMIADIDARLAENDGKNSDELKQKKATAEASLAALVKMKAEEG